jgi:hypothetical protein
MYQLLLKDGSKVGQYNVKAGPAQTAKKIAKVLYETQGMRGKRTLDFKFVKNRTIAEGGDKLYSFRATVTPLPKTRENMKVINGVEFYQKFDIVVENLLRD